MLDFFWRRFCLSLLLMCELQLSTLTPVCSHFLRQSRDEVLSKKSFFCFCVFASFFFHVVETFKIEQWFWGICAHNTNGWHSVFVKVSEIIDVWIAAGLSSSFTKDKNCMFHSPYSLFPYQNLFLSITALSMHKTQYVFEISYRYFKLLMQTKQLTVLSSGDKTYSAVFRVYQRAVRKVWWKHKKDKKYVKQQQQKVGAFSDCHLRGNIWV